MTALRTIRRTVTIDGDDYPADCRHWVATGMLAYVLIDCPQGLALPVLTRAEAIEEFTADTVSAWEAEAKEGDTE